MSSFRAVGIGMVKNEADIVEAFVRHNLAFVDALFLLDNGSVDGTREILRALEREGLPVVVLDDPEVGYEQSRKMSALLANATAVFDPDWIVPLDADEAISAPDREAFLRALEATPPDAIPGLPWRTYVPTEADDAGEANPLRRIIHRWSEEQGRWRLKVAVPRRVWEPGPVVLEMGNHGVRRVSETRQLPVQVAPAVHLAHFPVRSASQIAQKAICGWLAVLANPHRRAGDSVHWRDLYERALEGELPPAVVTNLAATYALPEKDVGFIGDPLASPVTTLRYAPQQSRMLLVTVARTAEQIALQPPPGGGAGRRGQSGGGRGARGRAARDETHRVGAQRAVARVAERLGAASVVLMNAPWRHAPVPVAAGSTVAVHHALRLAEAPSGCEAVAWWESAGTDAEWGQLVAHLGERGERVLVWVPAPGRPLMLAPLRERGWRAAITPTVALRLLAPSGPLRHAVVLVPSGGPESAAEVEVPEGSAVAERVWLDWPAIWGRFTRPAGVAVPGPKELYWLLRRAIGRVAGGRRGAA